MLWVVSYANGRTSYWFSIPQKSLISFSGLHETHDDNHATLDVDLVTMASTPDPTPVEARGFCASENPWKGPAHIRCTGTTEAGAFSAEFTTDGKPPEDVMRR